MVGVETVPDEPKTSVLVATVGGDLGNVHGGSSLFGCVINDD